MYKRQVIHLCSRKHTSYKSEIQILAVKCALPNELKSLLININIEQQRDDKIKKIINEIQVKENPKFQIANNVLYKLIDGQWKIMVPDHLVEDLTCLLYTSRCV